MNFLKAAVVFLFLQTTTLFINVYGQCPWQNGTMPSVLNGYYPNTNNLLLYTNGSAFGYYDILCSSGYALDPNIGGRITCLPSGSWSKPLPQCLPTGGCSIPDLYNFFSTNYGIQINQSLSFISVNGANNSQALSGSNITVQCSSGYTNIGGPLTIVCTKANSWTPFPKCNAGSTPTAGATPVGCPVTQDTWLFPNGVVSNTNNIAIYNNVTATGFVIVSCSAGYVIDSVSNGIYQCNNTTWSPRPYCIKTARCSISTLSSFLSNPTTANGLNISSQHLSTSTNGSDEALVGSSVTLFCQNGYNNVGGSLIVICNADGLWSNFPSCVPVATTAPSDTSTEEIAVESAETDEDGGDDQGDQSNSQEDSSSDHEADSDSQGDDTIDQEDNSGDQGDDQESGTDEEDDSTVEE